MTVDVHTTATIKEMTIPGESFEIPNGEYSYLRNV